MSKLGRYSAQRRKVEVIDASAEAATKVVEVHDCGTLFAIDATEGATITMPLISAAGNGWWCEFLIKTAGKAVAINLNAGDGASDALLIEAEDGGGKVSAANSDVTLAQNCPAGTRIVYQLADGKFFVDSTA